MVHVIVARLLGLNLLVLAQWKLRGAEDGKKFISMSASEEGFLKINEQCRQGLENIMLGFMTVILSWFLNNGSRVLCM